MFSSGRPHKLDVRAGTSLWALSLTYVLHNRNQRKQSKNMYILITQMFLTCTKFVDFANTTSQKHFLFFTAKFVTLKRPTYSREK